MKQYIFSPIETDWLALNCLLLRNTYRGPSALPLTTSLLHFPQSQWWQDTRSLSLIAQPRTAAVIQNGYPKPNDNALLTKLSTGSLTGVLPGQQLH